MNFPHSLIIHRYDKYWWVNLNIKFFSHRTRPLPVVVEEMKADLEYVTLTDMSLPSLIASDGVQEVAPKVLNAQHLVVEPIIEPLHLLGNYAEQEQELPAGKLTDEEIRWHEQNVQVQQQQMLDMSTCGDKSTRVTEEPILQTKLQNDYLVDFMSETNTAETEKHVVGVDPSKKTLSTPAVVLAARKKLDLDMVVAIVDISPFSWIEYD